MFSARWAALAAATTAPMVIMSAPAWSQMVSSLLNPVLGAWIRASVEQVDNLQVQVRGTDQELVNGNIPSATVSGENLLYEGFRVSQIRLDGQDIRLNVGEAIQGQRTLRLLAPVPVSVSMRLSEADLNQSLRSPMIQAQLAQAEVALPIGGQSVPFLISDPQVTLRDDRLQIDAQITTEDGETVPITLITGLEPRQGSQLVLIDPAWVMEGGTELPIEGLNNLPIELGDEVTIRQLDLIAGEVVYQGDLTIRPERI